MLIAKFIATFFAVMVLLKSFSEFKRGKEPLPVFLSWLFIWGTVLVVAYFPKLTDLLQEKILGPQAGLGTILGIAIVFLLFLSYRLYLKADRAEKDINKLISELALRDENHDQNNSSKKSS